MSGGNVQHDPIATPTRSYAATSPLKGEVKLDQKNPSAFGL
jgi:hypothetical protein